jgi:hypothetical protein
MKIVRYAVGVIGFLFVWYGVAFVVSIVVTFIFPPTIDETVTYGIGLHWRNLPGTILGLLAGIQSFRASVRGPQAEDGSPETTQTMKPHRAPQILVLGILSLAVCLPLGVVPWVMGAKDLKEMEAGTMDPDGRGMTQAGKICGIAATGMIIAGIIAVAVLYMLGYSLEEIRHMTGK